MKVRIDKPKAFVAVVLTGLVAVLAARGDEGTRSSDSEAVNSSAETAVQASWVEPLKTLPPFDLSDLSCNKVSFSRHQPFPDATHPAIDAVVPELRKLIGNFHVVAVGEDPFRDGVYRGAAPSKEGLQALHDKLKIRTILNVEDSFDSFIDPVFRFLSIKQARAQAEAEGIKYVSIKLSATVCEPGDEEMDQVLDVLKDPSNYPIYTHCFFGSDRTGLILGLYRHFVEGMPADAAYEEMCQHHFKPHIEFGFQCYFKRVTGLPVPKMCKYAIPCPENHHVK